MTVSMRGVNILHGLHQLKMIIASNVNQQQQQQQKWSTHVAKKSTTTGFLLFLTFSSKSSTL